MSSETAGTKWLLRKVVGNLTPAQVLALALKPRKGKRKTDGGLVPIVLSTLRQAGWWAERLQSGVVRGASGRHVRMARAGSPDVVAIRPGGQAVLVECKAPKGSIRPEQAHLAGWCREHRVGYVVVRTTDDVAKLVEVRR